MSTFWHTSALNRYCRRQVSYWLVASVDTAVLYALSRTVTYRGQPAYTRCKHRFLPELRVHEPIGFDRQIGICRIALIRTCWRQSAACCLLNTNSFVVRHRLLLNVCHLRIVWLSFIAKNGIYSRMMLSPVRRNVFHSCSFFIYNGLICTVLVRSLLGISQFNLCLLCLIIWTLLLSCCVWSSTICSCLCSTVPKWILCCTVCARFSI